MIQTKNVKVILKKGRDLQRVTTKNLEPPPRIVKPVLDPTRKSPLISTHNMGSIADMEEKRARDEILAQRKELKESDPAYVDDKGRLVTNEDPVEMLKEFAKQDIPTVKGRVVDGYEAMPKDPVKKPWNKMNSAERKEYKAMKAKEEKK